MNNNCEPNGFKFLVEDYKISNKNRLLFMQNRVKKSFEELSKSALKPTIWNIYNLFGTPSYEDLLEDLISSEGNGNKFRHRFSDFDLLRVRINIPDEKYFNDIDYMLDRVQDDYIWVNQDTALTISKYLKDIPYQKLA